MGPGGSQPGANASSATDPWRASGKVPELCLSFLGYEMGALLDSVATDVTGLGRDHMLTCPVPERSRPAKLSGGGRGWVLGTVALHQGLSFSEPQFPRLSHEHETEGGSV